MCLRCALQIFLFLPQFLLAVCGRLLLAVSLFAHEPRKSKTIRYFRPACNSSMVVPLVLCSRMFLGGSTAKVASRGRLLDPSTVSSLGQSFVIASLIGAPHMGAGAGVFSIYQQVFPKDYLSFGRKGCVLVGRTPGVGAFPPTALPLAPCQSFSVAPASAARKPPVSHHLPY